MNQAKRREVLGVLGMTGQGKSVWTRRYMSAFNRLFVFDPLGDADVEYITVEQLIEKYEKGDLNYGKHFRLGTISSDDIPFFTSVSFIIGNNLFCVEECALAFENARGNLDSWWRELIFLGRHQSVSLLFTAQRSVSIPIAVRSQFTRLVSFRQIERADVSWMRDYFADQTEDIPTLQELECIDSNKGDISRYKIAYDYPKQKQLVIDDKSGTENAEEGLFNPNFLIDRFTQPD